MMRISSLFFVLCASSCATARLVGQRAVTPKDSGLARTVVIEPLFEMAELQQSTHTEYATLGYGNTGFGTGFGSFGPTGPTTVAITRQVQEKPFFAKAPTLVELHRRVLVEVQRRRPSWRVTSTSGAAVLEGDVIVIRTIIEGDELVESNRMLKNLAFGFGLLIWPLQFFNITPVEETVRVYGLVERFGLDAVGLKARLVKYPSQSDYAVNLAGATPLRRPFGLDVSYEEGLLADERPRSGVLLDGFIDRLATAVIALVEETL